MCSILTLPIFAVLPPLPIAAWNIGSFTALGIVVTALLGACGFIYQVSNNRRASYVGIISDARLEWIGALRSEVATLLAFGHRWIHNLPTVATDADKLWSDIIACVYKARLFLTPKTRPNPTAAPSIAHIDNQLDQLIARFLDALQQNDAIAADTHSANLLQDTQALIWNEWLKIKIESIDGDPYDTVYHAWARKIPRYRAWFAKLTN